MRVLLTSRHVYPMSSLRSAGRAVMQFPSGSAQRIQDWTAKALAELGHEVVYYAGGRAAAPPPGVVLVDDFAAVDFARIDVAHTFAPKDEPLFEEAGVPYISVLHIHPSVRPLTPSVRNAANTVCVSRWLARELGTARVVHNGVDPSEYLYSGSKGDYLLFLATMDWPESKGLDVAIDVAARAGRRLVVAGGARSAEAIEKAARMCEREDVDFIGDVQGAQKRWLLAGAKALLHPSRDPEACPLTIIEAFASGTPVIATPWGGTAELVSEETGFLCQSADEMVDAAARLGEIDPRACRARALRDFHVQRMARDYLREYEAAIAGGRAASFTTVGEETSNSIREESAGNRSQRL